MLNREIRWHDLAFFDADMFEGLRKLFLLSHAELEAAGLTFEARQEMEIFTPRSLLSV